MRAKVEDTDLVRSSVTDSLLRRLAENATFTKEGDTFFFPTTTVTSQWPVLEPADELKELDEAYPLEWPLAPSLCPPLPPPELRPTTSRLFLPTTPP